MGIRAYYNDIDPFVCAWTHNLIVAGIITGGKVDERSIKEITAADVLGYTRVHFFSGIAVWDYALNLAGWGDQEVWTGSAPCQPWSTAGNRGGTDDPRHLWPDWFKLIRKCRPPTIFGEQISSKDGLAWLDLVYADLEGEGYSVAAVDLPAACVGAPHVRQRIYFVASLGKNTPRLGRGGGDNGDSPGNKGTLQTSGLCATCNMANPHSGRRQQCNPDKRAISKPDSDCGLGNTRGARLSFPKQEILPGTIKQQEGGTTEQSGGTSNFWGNLEWLLCTDGKYRPTQPGICPVAPRSTGRVGKLRAYGNAIVAPLAVEFIRAYLDVLQEG